MPQNLTHHPVCTITNYIMGHSIRRYIEIHQQTTLPQLRNTNNLYKCKSEINVKHSSKNGGKQHLFNYYV